MEVANTAITIQKDATKKENIKNKIFTLFWIFIIGSILGYITEMIVGLVQNGHFVSRQGLLYGPFIPVYGAGLLVFYLIIPNAKTNMQIFIFSMILGGVVEYLFSYFQQRYFGTISWDYSNLLFNINGRTSLLHCTYWGIGGILFMKIIYPYITKIQKASERKITKVLTTILIVFMCTNILISVLASQRQLERRNNIMPNNCVDIILDKYYPDNKLNKIYSNAKEK